jgi:hypothetical protein
MVFWEQVLPSTVLLVVLSVHKSEAPRAFRPKRCFRILLPIEKITCTHLNSTQWKISQCLFKALKVQPAFELAATDFTSLDS